MCSRTRKLRNEQPVTTMMHLGAIPRPNLAKVSGGTGESGNRREFSIAITLMYAAIVRGSDVAFRSA